ncbi:outer membrane protein [Pontibacter ruber]|uniref:Outer membrane protein n=1 Tax=Pontibacter ruber TaxID=1343895 RepID=A0ABW5CW33_9BACT|nr:outer membrane beta-barrel protein [Pontibacter ruber]
MKKLLLLFTVMLASAGAAMAQGAAQDSTQNTVQEQSKIRLNAGLIFGSKSGMDDDGSEKGGIGLNVGGEYFFTDKIAAAPSFDYFFKSSVEKTWVRVSSLNLDGRYYFAENGGANFYGIAGISVAFAKVGYDYGDYGKGSASDSETGLNIGAGLVYPLESFDFNAQVKYNTPLEQFVLQAGVSFPLNLK